MEHLKLIPGYYEGNAVDEDIIRKVNEIVDYINIATNEKEPSICGYKGRVIEEKEEIDKKIKILKKFMLSDKWDEVKALDMLLLEEQMNCMGYYSDILRKRIDRF